MLQLFSFHVGKRKYRYWRVKFILNMQPNRSTCIVKFKKTTACLFEVFLKILEDIIIWLSCVSWGTPRGFGLCVALIETLCVALHLNDCGCFSLMCCNVLCGFIFLFYILQSFCRAWDGVTLHVFCRHGAHNWEGPGALTAMTALREFALMADSCDWIRDKPSPDYVIFAGTDSFLVHTSAYN